MEPNGQLHQPRWMVDAESDDESSDSYNRSTQQQQQMTSAQGYNRANRSMCPAPYAYGCIDAESSPSSSHLPPLHPSHPAENGNQVRMMNITRQEWKELINRGYTWNDLETFICRWKLVYFGEHVRATERGFRNASWDPFVTTACIELQVRSDLARGREQMSDDVDQTIKAFMKLLGGYPKYTRSYVRESLVLFRFLADEEILSDSLYVQSVHNIDREMSIRIAYSAKSIGFGDCTFLDDGECLCHGLVHPESFVRTLDLGRRTNIADVYINRILRMSNLNCFGVPLIPPQTEWIESICCNKSIECISVQQGMSMAPQSTSVPHSEEQQQDRQHGMASSASKDQSKPKSKSKSKANSLSQPRPPCYEHDIQWILRLMGTDHIRNIGFYGWHMQATLPPEEAIKRMYNKMQSNRTMQRFYVDQLADHLLWKTTIEPALDKNRIRSRQSDAVERSHDDFSARCVEILNQHQFLCDDPDYVFQILRHAHLHNTQGGDW